MRLNPLLDDKIDKLAIAVGKGFQEVHEHMDRFEGRMDTLEEKVNIIRQENAEARYDHQKLKGRVENLEIKNFGSVQE